MIEASVPKLYQKANEPRIYRKATGHLVIKIMVNRKRLVLTAPAPPIPIGLWNAEDRRVRLKPFKHKGITFTGGAINNMLETYIAAIKKAAKLHPTADKARLLKALDLNQTAEAFYPKVFSLIASSQDITAGTKAAKKGVWKTIERWFPNLTWETVDMEFYDALIEELTSQNYHQPGKYVKEVKAMCRLAADRDLPVSRDYLKRSFKVVWNATLDENDSAYLEASELDTLYEINDPIINQFLIACYFGLRWSDWGKAVPENVRNGALHIVRQQKTKKPVSIPVNPRVWMLWERPLKLISSQKTNEHLETIAGIYFEGKKITTKSARKTFVTLLYNEGMPTSFIYKMTGHSTESQLRAYMKLRNEDIAELVKGFKFFS